MRDRMDRCNPVIEVDDMLPGGPDEYNPPMLVGLTLGYIPMPCLSIVIWRCNVVICSDDSDAVWTGAVLVLDYRIQRRHYKSPELPHFRAVHAIHIPLTALEIN